MLDSRLDVLKHTKRWWLHPASCLILQHVRVRRRADEHPQRAHEHHHLGAMAIFRAAPRAPRRAEAIGQFLSAWAWQTCLMWASSNQALRWQLLFLKSAPRRSTLGRSVEVLSLDITWFDTHEPAGLAAKLEADIAQVQIFMSAGLGFLISSVGQFCSGIVVAFFHGWQLTLIAPRLPGADSVTRGDGHAALHDVHGARLCEADRTPGAGPRRPKARRQVTRQTQDFARASSVAEESLMGVRTVAAFGAEKFQQDGWVAVSIKAYTVYNVDRSVLRGSSILHGREAFSLAGGSLVHSVHFE